MCLLITTLLLFWTGQEQTSRGPWNGKDEPGMNLQREVKRDQWIDYLVNGKPVKSPVDLDALQSGKYRLVWSV